jgi:hypothetical protein
LARPIYSLRQLPVVTPTSAPSGVQTSRLVGVVPTVNLPSYAAYTPALTAASVNPTLGVSSTATGRYIQVGELVDVHGKIVFGSSGTAAGTGDYYISLPVNAAANIQGLNVGTCHLVHSGSTIVSVRIDTGSPGRFFMQYPATWPTGTATNVGAAAPVAWTVSYELNFHLTYEAA